MKNYFILFITLLLLSCTPNGINMGAPPIPPDLCQEFDKSDSLLLRVQNEYNVPINEIYYGLIDTARILMISDVKDKEWIADYLDKVGIFYNEWYPNLTYDQLVSYMVSERVWGDKITLITSIVSTRIGYFRSAMFINEYDDCMYRSGCTNAKKLLLIR